MESKNKDILFMAIAGIGLYLFFKKKSTITPVVPPTTGGGIELKQPIAPSPVYEEPIDIIKTPVEPSKPIPIDVLPILSNPILDIIGITPIEPEPILKGKIEVGILDPGEYGDSNDNFPIKTLPIFDLPIFTKPEPIEPEPTLKGSIEVGVLDPGEYGDSYDNFPIIPLPIFDLPIFTKPEPIESEPTLKGSIEIGVLDEGEYVTETPVPNVNYGGGGTSSGGDFGGGGGNFANGLNFLFDYIWYNDYTLKGKIEVGDLDLGEFLE
jgi:hypothetical protein